MPLTHFPNGITSQTASAAGTVAGSGDIDCLDLFVAGTASVTGAVIGASASFTSNSIAGETMLYTFAMGSPSTAVVQYAPVAAAGAITAAFVVVGATITVTTGYTVAVGSAGAVAVATVVNTSGVAGGVTNLTTTLTAVTTANSIRVERAVQGTVGDTWLTVVVNRT